MVYHVVNQSVPISSPAQPKHLSNPVTLQPRHLTCHHWTPLNLRRGRGRWREGKRGEKSNVSKEHMKSEGGGRERKERERIQRRKEKEEERG